MIITNLNKINSSMYAVFVLEIWNMVSQKRNLVRLIIDF